MVRTAYGSGYSLQGVAHFYNVPEFLEGNHFPEEINLGRPDNTIWYICLRKSSDGTCVYPSIFLGSNAPKHLVEISLNIKNNDDTDREIYKKTENQLLISGDTSHGPEIPIFILCQEENGWLNYGRLSIDYTIRHWGFAYNSYFVFNFIKPLPTSRSLIFPNQSIHPGYQMLQFHSPLFDDDDIDRFEEVRNYLRSNFSLHLIHGVRLRMLNMIWALDTLNVAAIYKLHTVTEYCQREIIEQQLDSDQQSILSDPYVQAEMRIHNYQCDKWTVFFLEFAMKLGLRHYLCHLLKGLETFDEFMDSLRKIDLEKCKGESMKMMMKHFYEKF